MDEINSILTSVKKMLGITKEYDAFDADIIMHINSVFDILTQLGVGPKEGFVIEDDGTEWSDFIDDINIIQSVKSYVFLKVKMIFDPPTNGITAESYKNQIAEFEWRLNVSRDPGWEKI